MIALRLLLPLVALALSGPVDFLALTTARVGAGIPSGWKIRSVRGQDAPAVEIRNDGEGAVLRIQGADRAAWFYRELASELPEGPGTLQWSWRVLEAPVTADLRNDKLDDSPIRVFVVFGHPGLFRRSARIIFYTFGNGEPIGYERESAASDKLHVIRVDGAAQQASWREYAVDPFADFRRIWKQEPPAITAVGVMQDTDQTRERAMAELRRFAWVPHPDARQ